MSASAIFAMNAETYTFVLDATAGYANETEISSLTDGPITISLAGGANSNGPKYYATGTAVRVYASNTLKFTCKTEDIVSVDFEFGSGYSSLMTSSSTTSGELNAKNTGWTGQSGEFTITNGTGTKGQTRLTKIIVNTGTASKIASPTIDINAGTYFETQKVTLECATADAKIYYTTDGTEPSTASTEYTAPIEVASSMTIKAIAAKGTELSSVLTAAYEIVTPENVATIAEFLAKEDGSIVKFSTPLTVVKHHEARLFVTDGVDYTLIYGTITAQYEQGQAIPAGAIGYKTTYNGLLELEKPVDASFGEAIESTISLTPIAVNISEITEATQSKYIKIANVSNVQDGKNGTVSVGEESIPTYNQFDITIATTTDKKYDLYGIATIFGKDKKVQIYPLEFVEATITNIEDITSNSTVIVSNNGAIEVIGEASNIEVYSMSGSLVSKNVAKTICPNGVYIVKVDGKASKVVVK